MTHGTEGYERAISRFIKSSQDLDFQVVCNDFLEFLPIEKGNILDVGSGAGQNSAALADMGFNVTAIEPMSEFLSAAQDMYKNKPIKWLFGSLPYLSCLGSATDEFEFVLIEGVWHHLNEKERIQSALRISNIVRERGNCAISLRNGPAGLGSWVYPTHSRQTIELFEKNGFRCIFSIENQDSILPNKKDVKWSRIVLQKWSMIT